MYKLINRYIEYLYVIIVVLAIIAAHACNPVKKVMNDPVKVKQVYDAYILKNPSQPDTNTIYLPGDTITKVIVAYDTTLLKGKDSLTRDTIRIKNNIYTDRYIHDTVKITTRDTRIETDLRNLIVARDVVIDQKTIQNKESDDRGDKWKLYFFILLITVIVVGGLSIYIKTINRVKI